MPSPPHTYELSNLAGLYQLEGMLGVAGVLWTVAPSLVFFLFIYAVVGTWLTTSVFGKRLMQLQYLVLQKEGDLRFDLVRTRENSGGHTLHLFM